VVVCGSGGVRVEMRGEREPSRNGKGWASWYSRKVIACSVSMLQLTFYSGTINWGIMRSAMLFMEKLLEACSISVECLTRVSRRLCRMMTLKQATKLLLVGIRTMQKTTNPRLAASIYSSSLSAFSTSRKCYRASAL
jgi:hypothetical protein